MGSGRLLFLSCVRVRTLVRGDEHLVVLPGIDEGGDHGRVLTASRERVRTHDGVLVHPDVNDELALPLRWRQVSRGATLRLGSGSEPNVSPEHDLAVTLCDESDGMGTPLVLYLHLE